MTKKRCDGVVLVVDDEEDTRELVREILEARGFRVATAEDGLDALEVIGGIERICFVLLDLIMPRMDGAEVLEKLVEMKRSLPVWISTSAPDRAPVGVPCLPKPVDIARLLAVVEEHCAPSSPHASS